MTSQESGSSSSSKWWSKQSQGGIEDKRETWAETRVNREWGESSSLTATGATMCFLHHSILFNCFCPGLNLSSPMSTLFSFHHFCVDCFVFSYFSFGFNFVQFCLNFFLLPSFVFFNTPLLLFLLGYWDFSFYHLALYQYWWCFFLVDATGSLKKKITIKACLLC